MGDDVITDMDTSPELALTALDKMLACELPRYPRTKPQVLRLGNLRLSLLEWKLPFT